MKIGILTAMQSEHDLLADLIEDKRHQTLGAFSYTCGTLGAGELWLRQCGIGKVNAAVATAEMIKELHPDCIVSTGVAGGIDECLRVMDVVVGRQSAHHDVWCGMGCERGQVQGMPTRFDADPRLCQAAEQLDRHLQEDNPASGIQHPAYQTRIHFGLICTGDQFITDSRELAAIKDKFPDGLACDMETAAIAQTCRIYGVPFVSFRIISDTPGQADNVSQYENFWGEMATRSFTVTRAFLESLTVDDL